MEIEVTTESDRVIEMAAGMQPDVVATELGLEGLKDVNLVRRLRDAAPLSAIVGWTRLRDPGRVALVLASGASGYLLKEDGVDEAARAIQAAGTGTIVLTRSAATLLGNDLGGALARVQGARGADPRHGDPDGGRHHREAQFLANICTSSGRR